MRKQTLVDYFGSVRKAASALGYTTQAVYKWPEDRVPERVALLADAVSNGKLRYKPEEYSE